MYINTVSSNAPLRARAMTREARKLSVSIDRSAAEAYEFLSAPENFPKWASWMAETAESPAAMRFSERNRYGVLDHSVQSPRGARIYVPLRVVADGGRCDLVLTLFRRPDTTDEKFAADAERVMRDLQAAKRLLEAQ